VHVCPLGIAVVVFTWVGACGGRGDAEAMLSHPRRN
jgi:hypothetical protein